MEIHQRAQRVADLIAQEVDVLTAAHIPVLVRPACIPRLISAAARQGHP